MKKKSKYTDVPCTMQVIGCVFLNQSILDDDRYSFTEEDFTEEFHKVLFGSIYNLHLLGVKDVTTHTIEDYLREKTNKYAVYQANKGAEYLSRVSEITQVAAFDYYYHRLKKFTLFRMFDSWAGINLSWLYDPDNILDAKKKQQQEEWLDKHTEQEIVDVVNRQIDKIKIKCLTNTDDSYEQAGQGIVDLIENLKENPEIGYPLYGSLINTITRGARLKKFYIRSGSTGTGKTRSMIADIGVIGCSEYYDKKQNKWISCGKPEPVAYIGTEQELDEFQTMLLAFVSEVNESHILYNEYEDGEWERVQKAADIISNSKIYTKIMMDFSLSDIENAVKAAVRDYNVKYCFLDYIHSSMKILSEIAGKAAVKGLREDNVLFMMSVKLKDLCNQYGIFLMSATQVSNDYHTAKVYDQGLLQGAKAIANKCDTGLLMLEVTEEDKEILSELIQQNGFDVPDIKMSVYKNRRGMYKNIILWCKADRGVCRINPMFATGYDYRLVDIPDLQITVQEEKDSVIQ